MDPTVSQAVAILWQIAMGVGLAACAGLRAFLPLFVVGIAGRLELIPLAGPFEWIASVPALVVFGVAVVTELLADKIPVLDHFLDAAQGLIKPIAGTILAASVLTDLSPLLATVLGLVVGGTIAGGVHLGKAKVRLLSSVSTAGVGNPLLSLVEDAVALVGSVASVFVPLLVAAVFAALVVAVWFGLRRMRSVTSAARHS